MLKNKLFISLSTFFIIMSFIGCGIKQPEVLFTEVYVPTKCDVKERKRPPQQKNFSAYLAELFVYVEGLERDLAYCRGEGNGDSK